MKNPLIPFLATIFATGCSAEPGPWFQLNVNLGGAEAGSSADEAHQTDSSTIQGCYPRMTEDAKLELDALGFQWGKPGDLKNWLAQISDPEGTVRSVLPDCE